MIINLPCLHAILFALLSLLLSACGPSKEYIAWENSLIPLKGEATGVTPEEKIYEEKMVPVMSNGTVIYEKRYILKDTILPKVTYSYICPPKYDQIICPRCNGDKKITWTSQGDCKYYNYKVTKEDPIGTRYCAEYNWELHSETCPICGGQGKVCQRQGITRPPE